MPSQRERSRDLDRFITFIDAIVAIAITLLILPLVELASDIGEDQPLGAVLRQHSGQLWSFAISFLVIFRMWLGQHRLMSGVVEPHRSLEIVLGLWVLLIVVLPFATQLVANFGQLAGVKTFYLGTIALCSGGLATIALLIRRHPEIAEPDHRPDAAGSISIMLLVLVALAISLIFPQTSYLSMFVLVLVGPFEALLRKVMPRFAPDARAQGHPAAPTTRQPR